MIKMGFSSLVEDGLILVEERMRGHADKYHPDLRAAMEHLISSGGKRVRPVLTLLTGRMFGADSDHLVTLAAAIELLHTATLVHDDLIDGSLLRRGIPTLNSAWSPAATVLTGDFIFSKAAELAAETGSLDVMRIFSQTLGTIVTGEITQLFSRNHDANREDYYNRIFAKTASMFVLATRAAALLSRVDDGALKSVETYGYHVGMAFQIVDDILDFTGDQVSVGKPVASDLRQGVITLPAIYYHEEKPDDENMRAVLTGNVYNDEVMKTLVDAIRKSGVIDRAMGEARSFIGKGIEAVRSLPQSAERGALIELAEYVVNRDL